MAMTIDEPLIRMKRIAAVVNNPPNCDMPLTMVDSVILLTLWQAAQKGEDFQFSDLYIGEPTLKNMYQGAVAKLSYGRHQKGGQRSEALELVEHSIDVNDRRRRRLALTERGRIVAEALVEALSFGEKIAGPAPTKTAKAGKKPAAEPARDPATGKVTKAKKAA